MDREVEELFEQAMRAAEARDVPVSGWTLQFTDDGYAAWLYFDDGEQQICLFDDVDLHETVLGAVQACYDRAITLGNLVWGET